MRRGDGQQRQHDLEPLGRDAGGQAATGAGSQVVDPREVEALVVPVVLVTQPRRVEQLLGRGWSTPWPPRVVTGAP